MVPVVNDQLVWVKYRTSGRWVRRYAVTVESNGKSILCWLDGFDSKHWEGDTWFQSTWDEWLLSDPNKTTIEIWFE